MPAAEHAVGPRKPTSSGIGDRSSSKSRPWTPALAAASACASDVDCAVRSVSPVRVTPEPPWVPTGTDHICGVTTPHDSFKVGRRPGSVNDNRLVPDACRATDTNRYLCPLSGCSTLVEVFRGDVVE